MYYPDMPSIVGKRQGKQTYYYLVESARVGGKPRIVSQQYLGSAEEVIAKLTDQPTGRVSRVSWNFGDDPRELYAAVPTVSGRWAVSGWVCRYSAVTSLGICL